jgi:perosamine synthetase
MGRMYQELLGGLKGVQLPLPSTDYADNIYWVFGLVLDESMGMTSADAMKRLAVQGVGCRPFFYPMHQQPVLHKMGAIAPSDRCPVAEGLYERGFYIPSGLGLTEEQIATVAEKIRVVLR